MQLLLIILSYSDRPVRNLIESQLEVVGVFNHKSEVDVREKGEDYG